MTLPDWKASVQIEVKHDEILIRNLSRNRGIIQTRQIGTYLSIRYFISVLFFFFFSSYSYRNLMSAPVSPQPSQFSCSIKNRILVPSPSVNELVGGRNTGETIIKVAVIISMD